MLPSVQVATEEHRKHLIQRGNKGVRGAKNLGDAGGIESLVAGGSHRSSKMGTRFAGAQGDKG